MKCVLRVLGAALILAACGSRGSVDEAKLKVDCGYIMTDPKGEDFMSELGTDANGLCDCVVKMVVAGTEEEQIQSSTAFAEVADEMRRSGKDVKSTLDGFLDQIDRAPNKQALQVVRAGIDLLEDYFNMIEDGGLEDGVCVLG